MFLWFFILTSLVILCFDCLFLWMAVSCYSKDLFVLNILSQGEHFLWIFPVWSFSFLFSAKDWPKISEKAMQMILLFLKLQFYQENIDQSSPPNAFSGPWLFWLLPSPANRSQMRQVEQIENVKRLRLTKTFFYVKRNCMML